MSLRLPGSASARVAVSFAALFWVVCLSTTFFPAWLASIGLGTAQVGVVLAAAAWLKVPVTLLAGSLADRLGQRRLVLLLVAGFLAFGMPFLLVTHDFVLICVLWALLGALLSTCVPLTDSVGVATVHADSNANYGRMRLWGSVSFLICSLAGGWLIRAGPVDTPVWLMIGGAGILLVACLRLPDHRIRTSRQGGLEAVRALLALPGFAVTLFVAATLMASHAALYSLATLHWLSLGHSLPVIGALWAIGVRAEILVFYCAPQLNRRLGPWTLMLIAAMVGVVRWSTTAYATSLALLFAVQILHSVTFTFNQLALVSYIQNQVPARYTASAQTIYDSCAIGLVFGLALFVSGWVSTQGIHWSFLVMAAMSGGAGLIALQQWWRRRRHVASS